MSETDKNSADTNADDRQSAADIADWNQVAETYARSDSGDDRIYQQFRDVIWESLGDLQGRDVLDLGCGHGWLSQRMAEAGASVWGVDGSQALLDIARSRYPDIDFTQYNLAQGLPPSERKFDRVIANMVLMDIPDIDHLLAAVRYVLKPDGKFCLPCRIPAFSTIKRTRMSKQDSGFVRSLAISKRKHGASKASAATIIIIVV